MGQRLDPVKLWLEHLRPTGLKLVLAHALLLLLQWITFATYPDFSSRFDGKAWYAVCLTFKPSEPKR